MGMRGAESVRHAVVVPDFVLVIVVPARVDADVQHLLAQVLLPPANTVGMSEVDVRTLAVPELSDARQRRFRVLHECAARGDLGVRRVVVEQAWFEIDDHAHILALESRYGGARLGKLRVIPGEHVTALANTAVARTEMKRGERNVVPRREVEEFGQPRLRVGRIGQAHRRVGVTQAPARPERHSSGQLGELANDVSDSWADEKIVVEVAIVDLGVAIKTVIVVVFAAEIEHSRSQRVVEKTEGDPRSVIPADHEWPVLVQRVRRFRVVAERVESHRTEPAAMLVERAGLVAETEVAVARRPRHIVADGSVALAPLIRVGWPVGREHLAAG